METALASASEVLIGTASVSAVIVMACYGEDVFGDARACRPAGLSAVTLSAYLGIVAAIAFLWVLKCAFRLVCEDRCNVPTEEPTQTIRAVAIAIGLLLVLPVTTALPTWASSCAVGAYVHVVMWVWAATVWLSVARVGVYAATRTRQHSQRRADEDRQ